MLSKIDRYQSIGQAFLTKHSHLGQYRNTNAEFDISTINQRSSNKPIYHAEDRCQLFSVSDAPTMVIGEPLDIQPVQGQIDNWALALDQELYIKNATVVVWSRGTHILKTFDFSQENQKVKQVLFAWFPIPTNQAENKHTSAQQVDLNDANSRMQWVKKYWHKRGPQALLMDEKKPVFESVDKPMFENTDLRRRALCIVFLDRIQIHFEDGINFTAYIPFEIDNVVPLDIGLLISERPDAEHSKQKSSPQLSIPSGNSTTSWNISSRFVSITHPLLMPCPVKIERIHSSSTNSIPSTLSNYSHRLLFATAQTSNEERPPVIVTLNLNDNKHSIWMYERQKYRIKPMKGAPQKTRSREEFQARKRKRSSSLSFYDELNELNQKELQVYHTILDPSELSLTKLWQEQKRFNKRLGKRPIRTNPDNIKSTAFLVHNLNGEELICLHNKTTNQLQLINLEKAFQKDTNIIEFKSTAKSAISVNATRDSCKDLLFLDVDGHLWLWVDGRMPLISVPLPSSQPVIDISQNVYDRFNLQYQNETIRYRIHLQPKSSIVRNCLAAFDCAHTPFFATFWYRFIQLKQQHVDWTEWHVLFVSLFSFIPLKRTQRRLAKKILVGEGRQGIPDDWMDQAMTIQTEQTLSAIELNGIIKSLHVVYEDYRMKNTMKFHLEHLGYLLMQLCVILNHSSWIKYYQQEDILLGLTHGFCLAEEQIEEALIDPPKMEVCLQQMVSRSGAIPVLLSFFGVDTLTPTFTHCRNTYAKTVQDLWSMYHAIYYNDNDPALLVNRLTQCQINRMQIETLDRSIAAPILEALRRLQESPQLTWNKDFYYIIERYDIYKQLQLDTTVCDPNTDIFKLPLSEKSKIVSMDDIMNEVLGVPTQRCIYESDVLNMETERLRFGFGGVIEGVRTMLDASHIPEHTIPPTTSENDDDIATEHQSQVVFLVQRTLALATGRAIYAYATHIPDLTKTLPIEPIQLAAKILPLRTIVHLDESIWNKEFLQWPHFHNGIAAGLRISPSNQVNDSWISFCHSGDLEPHHGGMLLAMGLNGILRRLTLESWYHMIRQDCSLVSVGFILGIAAAYRNTEDKKVTKLLSAYIPALLDQQAAPFDQSNLILSSSLLGLGLIHMNTRDVKLAFVMLQELERNAANDLSGLETDYQTCALAAGFSLGFIMLGRGNDQRMDPDLFKRLCLLMLGNDEQRRINLDITSPGATMALGLMYLKTEADDVARLIEIPTTRPLLNYVRPDFLMLRAIARNLILWSQIQSTSEWIKDQVPAFMRQSAEDEDEQEVINQARYNIMSGAFLCLGLRFAGSKNQEAFTFLLRYLDHFIRLLNINAVSFQQRITHTIIRTCIDILCTAAAMIMAGTGNLGLLKRLKMLYGMVNGETSYGDHMAFSMSMGLLFAGLGGYTLTTTNEAIAGLLCAFYPFYPLSTDDNRYHLQAFRHLWVLAVDSRWLMPVEVSTKKPCRVPIQLEIYEDDHTNPLVTKTARQVRLEAPMVVPDYKLIKSIKIDGNRYWPLLIDMTVKSAYQESIKKSGVLHVQLKEGKKTYEEDPDGRSSLYEC